MHGGCHTQIKKHTKESRQIPKVCLVVVVVVVVIVVMVIVTVVDKLELSSLRLRVRLPSNEAVVFHPSRCWLLRELLRGVI